LARSGLAAPLLAGVATADITPPVGFPMWGYGARHDAPSVGVQDPLRAKAVVFRAGDDALALVGLDLGRSPTRASMQRIRDAVLADSGVQTLLLVGSHTHHGPVIETEDWPDTETPYVRTLESSLVRAIGEAARTARPVRIGTDRKAVPYNRNRHWRGPDAPLDADLVVVRLDEADGRPMAVLAHFAAHPTMEPAETMQFSADYPGHLTRFVEEAMGVPCIFLQGAAGDLSVRPGELKGARAFGEALGGEALALVKAIHAEPWQDARIRAREDDFAFTSRIDFSSPVVQALYTQAFYKALVDALLTEFAEGVRPHLTTAVLMDGPDARLAFVGVSGELFSAHALRLKSRSPVPTLVLGYCNGHDLYFPTIEAAAQGGYGGAPEVAPIEVGAGERMMDTALMRIFQMQGKL
jgi:hypothetical protein